MAPSYSERQAQYAAWRDRLRPIDEVIDLDQTPADDPWDPAALFREPEVIDLDHTDVDAGTSDQHG